MSFAMLLFGRGGYFLRNNFFSFFSSNFSLCEVTVAEGGIVKQRTLPDQLQNLAERIGLASRYYIKNKNSSESLLPDETVADLVGLKVHLCQLIKNLRSFHMTNLR